MDGGVELFGTAVSTLQDNVAVDGNFIVGTLKYKEGYTGFSSDTDLQEGNFLAVQWSSPAANITSCMVGLDPSQGSGLVETINDPDHNGVFRIYDNSQKFKIVQSDGTNTKTQTFSLIALTLQPKEQG